MSRDSTTKSASLPAAIEPAVLLLERRRYALPSVYASTASATVIRCSGNQPFGCLPSSVRRFTAASMPGERVERRDRPVGAERELRPGVEQRAVGVRTRAPLRADAPLGPAAVVDDVVRLHRRDHAQFLEPRVVLRPQVLDVFDAEAPVARAVLLRDLREEVEQHRVRLVADGVDAHVQPGRVGGRGSAPASCPVR